jgi:DNA polymerase-3 subunit alpha
VLSHFPGACPVIAQVLCDQECHTLRFGDGYRVDRQTSLFAELKVLLGEDCVLA